MGFEYIDYNNCLVNLANSMMRFCGMDHPHSTLKAVDKVIEEGHYESVVLMLFDGMGYNLLKSHLNEDDFLIRNLGDPIYSVFPPTTTAATTSVETGLYPAEHKWLGWNLWFDEIEKTVTIFLNTEKDTRDPAAGYNVARTYIPVSKYLDECSGDVRGIEISPFTSRGRRYPEFDLEAYFDAVNDVCRMPGKKAVYAYFSDPDGTMHLTGTTSKKTAKIFREINDGVEKMAGKYPNTLFIVTADHGHRDAKYVVLKRDCPEIYDLLSRDISIEGRACSFWIKDGCLQEFDRLFNRDLGRDFILMSHEEVVENRIFGPVESCDYERFVGDRLAIGSGDKYISLKPEANELLSHHAGITEDETLVPLIFIG